MLSLTGCASGGPGADEFCRIARPIYLGDADTLTRETLRAVLAHNEAGAVLCGWAPVPNH